MSHANIEVLEGIYARWRSGNFDTPEVFDPNVEVRWTPSGIDTFGTTRGIEATREMMRRWFEGLEDVRFEPERFVDLGDQVLVITRMRARGRSSGIEVSDRYGHLWTFRGGKAIRLEDVDPDDSRATPGPEETNPAGNAQILHSFFEDLNAAMAAQGDLDALAKRYQQPDVVSELGVVEGVVRGPDGFVNYIRGQLSIVDGMRIDPHEFIEVGDRIVMPFRLHGRSKHTGLPLDFEYVQLFTMRDGKIAHTRMYANKAAAVRALRHAT
jgi:ketosteroid isomerase-like protein